MRQYHRKESSSVAHQVQGLAKNSWSVYDAKSISNDLMESKRRKDKRVLNSNGKKLCYLMTQHVEGVLNLGIDNITFTNTFDSTHMKIYMGYSHLIF